MKEAYDMIHTLHLRKARDTDFSWLDYTDNVEESIESYLSEYGIEVVSQTELKRKDGFLYRALKERDLLDIYPKWNDWSWLDTEDNLEENINNYIKRNGLEGYINLNTGKYNSTRSNVRVYDEIFYSTLGRKGLLHFLEESTLNDWSWLDTEDKYNLIENLNNYITENGLEVFSRSEIRANAPEFYAALSSRSILGLLPK
mgnify:CR=1 FL=1